MVVTELYHACKRFKNDLEWLKEAKYFDKLDSTQKKTPQFIPKEEDGAVFVVSEAQSKAVGRQGRSWSSKPGGIWFTMALPMKSRTMADTAPFSLVVAHIVAKCLKTVTNLDCGVKWPNDILWKGKKLGGILITSTKKFKKSWLLVGIGINVNNELPPELKDSATTIQQIRGQSQGRSRLIESLMDAIWKAWNDFEKQGFTPYRKEFAEQLVGVGQSTRILIGKKSLDGTIEGIDPNGGLLLKSGENTQTIHAGEIVGQPA